LRRSIFGGSGSGATLYRTRPPEPFALAFVFVFVVFVFVIVVWAARALTWIVASRALNTISGTDLSLQSSYGTQQ
jgi:hypothetical protein